MLTALLASSGAASADEARETAEARDPEVDVDDTNGVKTVYYGRPRTFGIEVIRRF